MHELDEKTGASLKLSVLNPRGRIWTMVAGGGASVIYADTVADLGYAEELGNYAEYSGAPNMQVSLPSWLPAGSSPYVQLAGTADPGIKYTWKLLGAITRIMPCSWIGA